MKHEDVGQPTKGTTNGDLKLRHAAMVRIGSKHLNIAPNRSILPEKHLNPC